MGPRLLRKPATFAKAPAHVPSLQEGIGYASRLLQMLRPHWRRIAKGIGMSAVISIFGLVSPLLSKMFFDNVFADRDYTFLNVLVVSVLVVTVASALMNAVRSYYGQIISSRMTTEVGLLFFNRLQHMETRFFDERRVGEILSRSGDLNRSIAFVTGIFQTFLVNGIYLITVPPLLLLLEWRLALLALVTVPLTTGLSVIAGRSMRRLSKTTLEVSAEVSGYSVEVLSNIRVVKAVAAEAETFARMRERMVSMQAAQLRAAAFGIVISVLNGLVRAVGAALFSWFAWRLILDQRLSIGSFIAFSAYLGYLVGPVGQFAGLFTSFQDSAVSLGRFFEYYDLPVEQDPVASVAARATPLRRIHGVIEFTGVTFGYDPNCPVITDVSFKLEPGTVVALVGTSGAGKSSIVKLLLRLYSPQHGSITIDGASIEGFSLVDLRRQIGVVWQENGVLRGSLRENLTLGAGMVSDEEIFDAVRLSRLDDFVGSLPNGLDTEVSEWGGTLSGGQRQRLGIARALVRRNPILILDEPTSNLDASTEEALLGMTLPRVRKSAVLLVTHRMVSARLADRIFVIDGGRVSGGLPHEDLLTIHAGYRALWQAAGGASDETTATHEPPRMSERVVAAAGVSLRRL
jgi:ABC-type bacteriocin/lantibiotic exporter with double-glycine peptidase domain